MQSPFYGIAKNSMFNRQKFRSQPLLCHLRRKIIYKRRSLYKQLSSFSSYRKPVIFLLKSQGNVRAFSIYHHFNIVWLHTLFISFLPYSQAFFQELQWPIAQRGWGKSNGKEGTVLKVKCFLQVVNDAMLL